MPEVSRFYGIVIRMFFREHGPPHFHAEYSGRQAVVGIEDLPRSNSPASAGTDRTRRGSVVTPGAAATQSPRLSQPPPLQYVDSRTRPLPPGSRPRDTDRNPDHHDQPVAYRAEPVLLPLGRPAP